jgi:hypothetical protein
MHNGSVRKRKYTWRIVKQQKVRIIVTSVVPNSSHEEPDGKILKTRTKNYRRVRLVVCQCSDRRTGGAGDRIWPLGRGQRGGGRWGRYAAHNARGSPASGQPRRIWNQPITKYRYKSNCFTLSPRRPYEEYKRMVLEHTHGLFIT